MKRIAVFMLAALLLLTGCQAIPAADPAGSTGATDPTGQSQNVIITPTDGTVPKADGIEKETFPTLPEDIPAPTEPTINQDVSES